MADLFYCAGARNIVLTVRQLQLLFNTKRTFMQGSHHVALKWPSSVEEEKNITGIHYNKIPVIFWVFVMLPDYLKLPV